MEKNPVKLTTVQREILEVLAAGGMLTLDKTNSLSVNGKYLQPITREFLTSNKLITRLDKTRDIKSIGNGFVITDKGRAALQK